MQLRRTLLAFFLLSFFSTSYAQTLTDVWINEIHYDNSGSDQGEFIEIVVHANISDLSSINVNLYNGNNGTVYSSFSGNEFAQGDSEGSVTFYYLDLPSNGIQNGSPDGLSLDISGQLIQFLSYEGTLTASDGPAQGETSVDIGVEQTGASIGSSVSLTGEGSGYDEFSWINTESNSKGSVNFEQSILATESEIDEPTLNVIVEGALVDSGATITFEKTLTGNTSEILVELRNTGNDTLRINEIVSPTAPFFVSELQDSALAFNEKATLIVSFLPQNEGVFSSEGGLEIQSNAGVFKASLSGEAVEAGGIIPISTARDLPQGATVTLTGWVTVAEEFEGPVYFQDETGGIAWFNFGLMRDDQDGFTLDVQRGDSIVITGELGSFNDLIQIVGDDVQYEFFPDGSREIEPLPVTVSALNSGSYEGQLVSMNVDIDHEGVFQSSEYDITDATGSGVLYINDDTEIVGATAPEGETTIVGVVGIFSGTYQLLPRDLEDIDAEAIEIPGEDISKDETFEIVTWNIEWFGSSGNGPEDDEIQLMNVIEVIDSIDADVFALQEIANQTMFNRLIDSLETYEGVLAGFSQSQKTAYLYKTSTINVLSSGLLSSGQDSYDWANGRLPFILQFEASFDGEVREIFAYNIHAKALGDQEDYMRRRDASISLKNYLDQNQETSNVIVIGDYNDELEASSVGGQESPYKNFVDDEEYTVLTQSLEERGFTSYSSFSMIDHITISSELTDEYFGGTERVENPSYIGSYLSQTSDHYPVWVRFQWGMITSNEEQNTTVKGIRLDQNYPNPFNPSTTISYTLDATTNVTLEVFDMMGRKVSTLVQGRQTAGEQTINFDASALASGVYVYRLLAGGQVLTKKMILLK